MTHSIHRNWCIHPSFLSLAVLFSVIRMRDPLLKAIKWEHSKLKHRLLFMETNLVSLRLVGSSTDRRSFGDVRENQMNGKGFLWYTKKVWPKRFLTTR